MYQLMAEALEKKLIKTWRRNVLGPWRYELHAHGFSLDWKLMRGREKLTKYVGYLAMLTAAVALARHGFGNID